LDAQVLVCLFVLVGGSLVVLFYVLDFSGPSLSQLEPANNILLSQNPGLNRANGGWILDTFDWGLQTLDPHPAAQNNLQYSRWVSDGAIKLFAMDTANDKTAVSSQLKQSFAPIPFDTRLILKATLSDYGASEVGNFLSFAGIKVDAWAASSQDPQALYVEMYFLRAGANQHWYVMPPFNNVEIVRPTSLNYLVDITKFNQSQIQKTGDKTNLTINLTYFFQRATQAYNLPLQNYKLTQIGITLESAYITNEPFDIAYPKTQATIHYLALLS
jgi:hypothetical protein